MTKDALATAGACRCPLIRGVQTDPNPSRHWQAPARRGEGLKRTPPGNPERTPRRRRPQSRLPHHLNAAPAGGIQPQMHPRRQHRNKSGAIRENPSHPGRKNPANPSQHIPRSNSRQGHEVSARRLRRPSGSNRPGIGRNVGPFLLGLHKKHWRWRPARFPSGIGQGRAL